MISRVHVNVYVKRTENYFDTKQDNIILGEDETFIQRRASAYHHAKKRYKSSIEWVKS